MYELIRNFAGGYLYQEYEEDYENFTDALVSFLDEIEEPMQNQFLSELVKLKAEFPDEQSLDQALEEMDWDVVSEDGGAKAIISETIEITREFING